METHSIQLTSPDKYNKFNDILYQYVTEAKDKETDQNVYIWKNIATGECAIFNTNDGCDNSDVTIITNNYCDFPNSKLCQHKYGGLYIYYCDLKKNDMDMCLYSHEFPYNKYFLIRNKNTAIQSHRDITQQEFNEICQRDVNEFRQEISMRVRDKKTLF
jgi:hypothetical protein